MTQGRLRRTGPFKAEMTTSRWTMRLVGPAAYHKHRAAGPSPEELIPRRTPRDSTVTTTKRRRPKIRHPHATHEAIQARGPKA